MLQQACSAFYPDLRPPTETLDAFIEAMIEIATLAETDSEKLKSTPVTTPVSRPDEVAAIKSLNIACL